MQGEPAPPEPKPPTAAEIYDAYPRKADRDAAMKAIDRAIARVGDAGIENPAGYLLGRAQAFAASPAGQKPPPGSTDYRKHPATWFNAGSFDNDPAEWQRSNGQTTTNGQHRESDDERRMRVQRELDEASKRPLEKI